MKTSEKEGLESHHAHLVMKGGQLDFRGREDKDIREGGA